MISERSKGKNMRSSAATAGIGPGLRVSLTRRPAAKAQRRFARAAVRRSDMLSACAYATKSRAPHSLRTAAR